MRTVKHIFLFFLLFFVEQLPLTGLSIATAVVKTNQQNLIIILGISFLIIVGLMTYLYGHLYRQTVLKNGAEFDQKLNSSTWLPLILGFIAMFAVNAITVPFMQTSGNENVNSLATLVKSFGLFMFVFTAFFGPILEEIIFRGLFINWFFKDSRLISILLSSLVFGSVHVDLFGHVDLIYWLSKVLLGLILALVYNRTKNLKIPILLHILNNTLTLFL
ncbi:CPBP family intramembrane glutamic endopeptidase [Loigolactobacillus iwatensis]|uniref:CPBP family intramembrane glutamic endopeptidase n=1 Tax=Loigolactobacillus iwatensis TaxID=1267156 RepID=UPI000F7F11A4|nr:CPBP family intramembrane glutamic endopeptidase [Loigolactobacillus iwatensis]